MGRWDPNDHHVRILEKKKRKSLEIAQLVFQLSDVSYCAAGSGVKTSPTATMGGTKTVWSSGTKTQVLVTGMMRPVILSKTGSVRCDSFPILTIHPDFTELWLAWVCW